MYGLAGLLRSRLHDEYSVKKQKASKSILKQLHLRDEYMSKALQPYCVYEITEAREVLYNPDEVKGVTMSNYALSVLNMHISSLSGKIQQLRSLLQKATSSNSGDSSKAVNQLKLQLAKESSDLATVLEQGGKLYRESYKIQLWRYYANAQLMEKMTPKKKKKDKKHIAKVQKELEKGTALCAND